MLAGVVQGWCARCGTSPSTPDTGHLQTLLYALHVDAPLMQQNLDGAGGRRTRALTNLLVSSSSFSSDELWDTYGIDDDIVPFTNDFPRADIYESLSPDLLHQIIKAIYTKSRADEILDDIDRRIAMTPPFPGLRRFKHGRRFKQWTGDDSKALMKVYIPAIADVSPRFWTSVILYGALKSASPICLPSERPADISRTREIFRTSGVRPKGFNLPRQHSMVHYVHLIQEFGAPNGLCSSITESRHITAVKKTVATLKSTWDVSKERMPTPVTRPASSNEEDADGAIDGDIEGEVVLAIRPPLGSPSNIQSKVLVFHSARAIFYAPSDVFGLAWHAPPNTPVNTFLASEWKHDTIVS
ncbi:hypothetical protein EDB85DRAFT_1888285 [Lactarius pseudohatsudake]|nr:hypothetical protein EDB85DRAFT_1888285 [Lactarius pseudohatsudake]